MFEVVEALNLKIIDWKKFDLRHENVNVKKAFHLVWVEAFAKSKTVLLNLSKLANLSDTKPASKN